MDPLTNWVNNPPVCRVNEWLTECITDSMTDSVLLPLLLLGQLRNCLFSDWIFHKMRSLCVPSPSLYFSLAVSLYCCLHYLIASPFRPVGKFTRKRQYYANWINIVQFLMKCSAKFWPTFVVRCDAMSREKLATIGHTREVRKAGDNCRQHLLKIVLLSRVCVCMGNCLGREAQEILCSAIDDCNCTA